MDYAKARRAMIDSQLRPEAVTDPRVIAAMAVVPREQFVPVHAQASAYIDRPVPLGEGRVLSPPATLGRLLNELKPLSGERALVIDHREADLAQGIAGGGPFDLILLDGSIEFVPPAIVAQLAEGGRLGAVLIDNDVQRLVIGRRAGTGFALKSFADAAAAPLPGFARPPAFVF